jgi:hypothetical protein
MPQIGVALGITLPTPGGDVGVWGAELNVQIQTMIDAIESGVSSAVGFTVTADIAMAGYEFTDCGALFLRNKTTSFAASSCLYERDGELWWNDAAGNQDKLTANGALNFGSIGAIGGDFGGANPAAVIFNDAGDKFVFTTDPNKLASMEIGDILLGRAGETSPDLITLRCPASLGAAYTLTLPTARPSGTSVLTMTNAGVLDTTQDLVVDSLLAGDIAGTEVTTIGADIRHGNQTVALSPFDAVVSTGGAETASLKLNGATNTWYREFAASSYCLVRLLPPQGERIKQVRVNVGDVLGSAVTAKIFKAASGTTGARTQVGTTQTTAASGADQTLTFPGLAEDVAANLHYYVEIHTGVSAGAYNYSGGDLTTDRVA